ncbi:hypothetical protein KQI84_07600 [bacterium]|nr:hypothetical protein [bacterium]
MTPFPALFLGALIVTLLAEAILPAGRQWLPKEGGEDREPLRTGLGLWVGLMVSTLLAGVFQDRIPGSDGLRMGPSLWPLALAAAPLVIAALLSDFGRPRSERHALGLLLSGIALFSAGFSIAILTIPLKGTVAVGMVGQVILTTFWLFLLASIVELVSLIPLGVGIFGLAMAGVIWLSGGEQQSVASFGLAGIITGALVGRALGDLVRRRRLALGKAEIFGLGIWLTALTNISFLKSVALAGFVLPLGALAVAVILLTIRGFERSLLLRGAPRND